MQLGYTLVYVADVAATVDFYERAFGLARRFVHDSGSYAEMETGATALAFAAETLAGIHGLSIRNNRRGEPAAAFELCLVCDSPEQAYDHAVAAGATALKPVEQKPWGQKVGYVSDLNGCLVELCSPVSPG